MGFVSRGRGVIVHRTDCPNLADIDKNRLQSAQWTGLVETEFVAGIKVIGDNCEGLAAEVFAEISLMHLSLTQVNGRVNKDKNAEIDLRIKLNKRSDIDLLMNRLKRNKHIIDVFRTTN